MTASTAVAGMPVLARLSSAESDIILRLSFFFILFWFGLRNTLTARSIDFLRLLLDFSNGACRN